MVDNNSSSSIDNTKIEVQRHTEMMAQQPQMAMQVESQNQN